MMRMSRHPYQMDRLYINNRIVSRAITKAHKFTRINADMLPKMLASLNSYLGICKNVNGYNQSVHILKALPHCKAALNPIAYGKRNYSRKVHPLLGGWILKQQD